MSIGGKEYSITYNEDGEFPSLRIDIEFKCPNPKLTNSLVRSALIDTGSDFTIISESLIQPLRLIRTGRTEQIEGFDGNYQDVDFYSCRMKINGIIDEIWEVGVIDSDFILGMDFIKRCKLFIDCSLNKYEIAI